MPKQKTVCSDCGAKFEVETSGGVYDPTSCPGCNHTITSITPTATSEDFTAWVSEE